MNRFTLALAVRWYRSSFPLVCEWKGEAVMCFITRSFKNFSRALARKPGPLSVSSAGPGPGKKPAHGSNSGKARAAYGDDTGEIFLEVRE